MHKEGGKSANKCPMTLMPHAAAADATCLLRLQDAGILLSRKAHGAHHKAPFENNYAIVSGWWNPLLDAGGDGHNFWRKFEHFIKARTGAEPRCWYEPKYEVEERLSS